MNFISRFLKHSAVNYKTTVTEFNIYDQKTFITIKRDDFTEDQKHSTKGRARDVKNRKWN